MPMLTTRYHAISSGMFANSRLVWFGMQCDLSTAGRLSLDAANDAP